MDLPLLSRKNDIIGALLASILLIAGVIVLSEPPDDWIGPRTGTPDYLARMERGQHICDSLPLNGTAWADRASVDGTSCRTVFQRSERELTPCQDLG